MVLFGYSVNPAVQTPGGMQKKVGNRRINRLYLVKQIVQFC